MRATLVVSLGLLAANVAVWGGAVALLGNHPALLGAALVAWGLGLRHGLDADHIAAIDGATRKLVQAGQRPLGVGLFFALGHSAVVVAASMALAATATSFTGSLERIGAIGGTLGALVSIMFLLAIALVNAVILAGVWHALKAERAGVALPEPDVARMLAGGGTLAALCRPLFRLVGRSWHMTPLGFLFGLGFDTAASVALLGAATLQAGPGLSVWSIMVFPTLFTAGMVLVDTLDGLLMVRACAWAFSSPSRRLRYNLAITAVSVVASAGVALAGFVQLLSEHADVLTSLAAALDSALEHVGIALVVVFAALWLGAMGMGRLRSVRQA